MSFVFVIIQDLALSNKYFSDWSGFGNHSKRNNYGGRNSDKESSFQGVGVCRRKWRRDGEYEYCGHELRFYKGEFHQKP